MDSMETDYQRLLMDEHRLGKKFTPRPARKNLDLAQTGPVWNPVVSGKTRFVNENINGYVYNPRPGGKYLPSLNQRRGDASPRRKSKDRRSESVNIPPKGQESKSSTMSDDILPPLKFHASFNSHPFSRKPTKTPKWAFQDRDESSPRFQNGTFRVFRPMLYSVLLTNQILPKIRLGKQNNKSSSNDQDQCDSEDWHESNTEDDSVGVEESESCIKQDTIISSQDHHERDKSAKLEVVLNNYYNDY